MPLRMQTSMTAWLAREDAILRRMGSTSDLSLDQSQTPPLEEPSLVLLTDSLKKVSGLALCHLGIREALLVTGGSQTPEWSFWESVG